MSVQITKSTKELNIDHACCLAAGAELRRRAGSRLPLLTMGERYRLLNRLFSYFVVI
jgi:hypothetical protein